MDKSLLETKMDEIIVRMTDPPVYNDIVEWSPLSDLNFTHWNWPQGVGLYGLLRQYQRTRNPRYLAMMTSWFEAGIARGLPEKNVNTMAPFLTLIHLHELNPRPEWLALCQEWAAWVMAEMPRTRENGLQHIVINNPNTQQLWVDTLYMTVLFLAKIGRFLGRQDYIDEAVRQFLLHVKYLADPASGLWFHGWTFDGRHNFGRVHWGRGNCWYTAAVVDFFELVDVGAGVKAFLVETLKAQVDALIPLQDKDGMWHTVLDDPASYRETSCTAGFGYGILKAVRLGMLPVSYRPMGLRACQAVLDRTDATGTVTEVSYGTPVGMDADFYLKIPVCSMAYGQALSVLLLGEALLLPRS
ncbi:MAG: glycoside hydrolase family 88 protein [Spirochaetales bacterium]